MSLEHYKESTPQGTCRAAGTPWHLHQRMPGSTIGGFTNLAKHARREQRTQATSFRIDWGQQATFVGKREPSNLQRRGHFTGGGYQHFKSAWNDVVVVPKVRVPLEVGVILTHQWCPTRPSRYTRSHCQRVDQARCCTKLPFDQCGDRLVCTRSEGRP